MIAVVTESPEGLGIAEDDVVHGREDADLVGLDADATGSRRNHSGIRRAARLASTPSWPRPSLALAAFS